MCLLSTLYGHGKKGREYNIGRDRLSGLLKKELFTNEKSRELLFGLARQG